MSFPCPVPSAPAPRPADPAAFESLFRQHRAGLLRFLTRRLRNRDDAEDALMQTFYQAWRARDSYRGDAAERQWLYSIAGRVAIDLMRAALRRPTAPLDTSEAGEAALPHSPDPLETVLRSQEHAEVRQAVERLAPDAGRLIDLFYYRGWRYAEIGTALGIPQTRVKGRLHRARARIERELAAGSPAQG